MCADNRVIDVQLVTLREDKESITGAFATIFTMVFGALEESSELLGNGVTNNDEGGGPPLAIDNGEQWLAAMVLMQESRYRCHTAMASIHGAHARILVWMSHCVMTW